MRLWWLSELRLSHLWIITSEINRWWIIVRSWIKHWKVRNPLIGICIKWNWYKLGRLRSCIIRMLRWSRWWIWISWLRRWTWSKGMELGWYRWRYLRIGINWWNKSYQNDVNNLQLSDQVFHTIDIVFYFFLSQS